MDLGRFGVDVFFVIAGFSVMTSYAACPDFRVYIIQRLLRIVPLYWCAICVIFVAHHWGGLPIPAANWLAHFGVKPDTTSLLLQLSFLSLFDYRIVNSLIGVEWTLPVEVFYYLLIPTVLICWRSAATRGCYWDAVIRVCLLLLAVWVGVSVLSAPVSAPEDGSIAERWHPLTHVWPFALGVLAFYLRPYAQLSLGWPHVGRMAACVMVVVALIWAQKQDILLQFATCLFIVCAGDRCRWTRRLFCNRVVLWGGLVSYSFYLVHMPVIHWLPEMINDPNATAFPVVLLITVLVSALCYSFIERPARILGRRLARKTPIQIPAMAATSA